MDLEGAGPDAPMTTNEHGGSQSHIPYRFDLIDGPALAEMAKVLKQGADKYGENNWRKIPDVTEHLNHMIMHAYAWMAGDRTDDHLSHIMCRAMFAQAVDITNDSEGNGVDEPYTSEQLYEDNIQAMKKFVDGPARGTEWYPVDEEKKTRHGSRITLQKKDGTRTTAWMDDNNVFHDLSCDGTHASNLDCI